MIAALSPFKTQMRNVIAQDINPIRCNLVDAALSLYLLSCSSWFDKHVIARIIRTCSIDNNNIIEAPKKSLALIQSYFTSQYHPDHLPLLPRSCTLNVALVGPRLETDAVELRMGTGAKGMPSSHPSTFLRWDVGLSRQIGRSLASNSWAMSTESSKTVASK